MLQMEDWIGRPSHAIGKSMRSDSHIYGLDLVRGLCAVGIAVYHYLAWEHAARLESLGTFGVFIFFIISALVLMVVYGHKFSDAISRPDLLKFFQRRAARIIPLLAAVALIALPYRWLMNGIEPISNLGETVIMATGLFALHAPGYIATTPGAWSLGIELLFYAAFPLVALLLGACSIARIAIVGAILIAAQQILLATLPPRGVEMFGPLYFMPLTMAPFFVMGMLIYKLPNERKAWGAPAALLSLVAVFTYSELFPFYIYGGGWQFVLLTAMATIAVYAGAVADLRGIARPIAKYLGDISYSLYLTHWIAFDLSGRGPLDEIRPVAFAVLALMIATGTTYLFEMPARKWLIGGRTKPSGPTVEVQASS